MTIQEERDAEAFRQISVAYRRLDKDYEAARLLIQQRDFQMQALVDKISAVMKFQELVRGEILRGDQMIAALKDAVRTKRFEAGEAQESLSRLCADISRALAPCGNYFMDPPDGGDVVQAEFIRRLVASWIEQKKELDALRPIENDLVRLLPGIEKGD